MFIILLRYPRGFYFTNFLVTSRIYANPHLLCTILVICTILVRYMMSIFPNCVKNVRVQALSDSVKFSRRLMQKILDLIRATERV